MKIVPIHIITTLGFALATTQTAHAQQCLSEIPLSDNVVVVSGDSGFGPLFADISYELQQLDNPIQIVYKKTGSCGGVQPFVDNSKLTGTAVYWDADSNELNCDLPTAGVLPDMAVSAVGATNCDGIDKLPSDLGDFLGPVNEVVQIVPVNSTQQVISAEALYFIYGMGGDNGKVSPWNDSAHIFGRTTASGTLTATALAAHVPPATMQASFLTDNIMNGEGDVRDKVALGGSTQAATDGTLGFVGGAVADASRAQVRILAYQAWGQSCGYTPDSDVTSFDKANVRDGHYDIWAAFHLYAPVDKHNVPTKSEVEQLIGYVTGDVPTPDSVDMLESMIKHAFVPRCAMRAWRDKDLGPLYSYMPDQSCEGYFEATATGSTSHKSCSSDKDCSKSEPACNYGYCEVQ